GLNLLISNSPYKAYALAAQKLFPEENPAGGISPAASVDQSAKLGKGCTVEAGAVILEGAEIGDYSLIEANAVIGRHVKIGDYCRIGYNASVSHSMIGDHVRL